MTDPSPSYPNQSPDPGNAASAHQAAEEIRRLRHDIRGCMHGLMLLISALETPMSDQDRVEFLDDILNTATKMEGLMDHLATAPEFGAT